jgi:hypothetical protein
MPIYEYYCPDNHRIYQFYARSLAQGSVVPPCPDNPALRMQRILSPFSVAARGGREAGEGGGAGEASGPGPDDSRMDAALGQMEREFAGVDENDPKAMGRMMRRMAEITGEPIEGQMEEAVRRLEEGADPEALDEELGGEAADPGREGPLAGERSGAGRGRRPRVAPQRDPRLYDYP